ncbi:MAG TPA: amidohydrolase [Chitinophagaceae bacterium]|nr:amidohydrolase [Chitinophagaceae bacterium]
MKRFFFPLALVFFITGCSQKKRVDLLVHNATIYTVDSSFSVAEAMAVDNGKIVAIGKLADLENDYRPKERLDGEGGFIYPGFIDAHSHFASYGTSLRRVNLVGTKSWEEVLQRTRNFASTPADGWLLGGGWDQNDWAVKEFPTNDELNRSFPDRPVVLTRIDGHAAIANQKALDFAGVRAGQEITGGEIVVKDGKLTGVLIDNAVDLVSARIPAANEEEFRSALHAAERNCLAVGLTTVSDCGLGHQSVDRIRKLHEAGQLNMRMYVMLSDEPSNYQYLAKNGIIKTDRLTVRSIKLYADGALGSRGACLLAPYSDQPGKTGFLLSPQSHFDSMAAYIKQQGWQMCTHAIGDSGNRVVLDVYGKHLGGKNDLRWRIEHAQVVSPQDFALFGKYNVIPSVQPTHATSDMYWAADRLGSERVKHAYALNQLLNQNGWIALGTDFPVEDISPLKTFFAAVVRRDTAGFPPGGYQMENALSREEALRGITIWAAKAHFEEKEKGSLEKEKWADFVVLDQDLMRAPEEALLNIRVKKTFIAGKKLYEMRPQ